MSPETVQRISQQQLESYLWGAATLLRGTIDAGDYKQFIFPLLFYKRLCDVYDEERAKAIEQVGQDFPESHRFQIPEDAHWDRTREVTNNVGQAIQSAMRAIEKANQDKLYGIFGDAQWTNKDRLSDAMLRDLIEHFSSLDLTIVNLPEDELGNGYEYLIKKFADDSGHTAAEFYTNRTVVHLMTELLQPQPGESIYDPTCGSGGMLLSAIAHLRNQGKEWRNVKLYGQELNLMTSSIARMNCFLHGIEDFEIKRGNTLSKPLFIEGGQLQKFDVILANPPYSIKQWDRGAFENDPWGRNQYGTPPQSCADYAFQQHINKSLDPDSGRCAILWPHGILFRRAEREIRRKMIEDDLVECVIGLGKNLFYNSAMEACILICRTIKPIDRQGKILLIGAVDEVTHERGQSFLTNMHIERIADAYHGFNERSGFSKIITQEEALANDGSLAIPLYVEAGHGLRTAEETLLELGESLAEWSDASQQLHKVLADVIPDVKIGVPKIGDVQEPDWLDRSSWKRVKLGDVAVRTAKKVETESDEIQRWVAADHMDEGDIHIRRWSTTDDPLFPPTFRYTFQAGTVMIHSRNPKKVCMPEFDGITGEKIFVLNPHDGTELLNSFLLAVLGSTRFGHWVTTRLAGSVNKFLNWTALADFEFDLPPVAIQARIADVLSAVDDAVERAGIELRSVRKARVAELAVAFGKRITEKPPHSCVPLQDVATLQTGMAKGKRRGENANVRPVPYLRVANVQDGWINTDDMKHLEVTEQELERYRLKNGDLVICEGGDFDKVGRGAMFDGSIDPCIHQNHIFVLRSNDPGIDQRFLTAQLQSPYGKKYFLTCAKRTSNLASINSNQVKNFPFQVPPEPERERLVEITSVLDRMEAATATKVERARVLQTRLREVLV